MIDFAKQTKATGKTDEWLTPESAVYPLIPWLKENSTIWCPFDKGDSAFLQYYQNNLK